MTTAEPKRTDEPPAHRTAQSSSSEGFGRRHADLTVPALTAVIAVCLLLGGTLMSVPEASGFLGPRFFPLTIGALLMVTALVTTAWPFRPRRTAHETAESTPASAADTTDDGAADAAPARAQSDWRALAMMAATLAGHVILLQPLGWLLAGTLLFWGISCSLDRRRPVFDLCIAVTTASAVQLVFSGLLGVELPAGILGKVF